jgi:7-carboxy-7-deazaguanine synthase
MFGKNPKRKIEIGSGDTLYVEEIFATIQGEGPLNGTPSVFLRLGGCNLACTFCDTEFENFQELAIEEIISQIDKIAIEGNKKVRQLVVITGGEPFRQPISKICQELIKRNYQIQIETNGTIYRDIPKEVMIICSPKNLGTGYKMIREDLLQRLNGLKFIISANNDNYNNVSEVGQTQYNIPVFVQPMDEYDPNLNEQNLLYTLNLALKNGYRFSIQLHKLLNIK